jgi:hypothetical protein
MLLKQVAKELTDKAQLSLRLVMKWSSLYLFDTLSY